MAGEPAGLPQLVMVHWKKSPTALFQTAASLPLAKGAAFASYVMRNRIHA
jgi:hypothetical protein